MKYLREFFTMHVLQQKYMNNVGLDRLVDRNERDGQSDLDLQLKNVCAKLPAPISNRIDATSKALGMSKRLFIETAILNALDEFEAILDEHDCVTSDDGEMIIRIPEAAYNFEGEHQQ